MIRGSPVALLLTLALSLLLHCSCFATPSVDVKVPAAVPVALAGGDISTLDENTPSIEYSKTWFDGVVVFRFVDTKGDRSVSIEFESYSSAAEARQARESDNSRSTANVDRSADFLLDALASVVKAKAGPAGAGGAAVLAEIEALRSKIVATAPTPAPANESPPADG